MLVWSGVSVAAAHAIADTTAVLAALSFWDYAPQADRALPGVGEAYKATGADLLSFPKP